MKPEPHEAVAYEVKDILKLVPGDSVDISITRGDDTVVSPRRFVLHKQTLTGSARILDFRDAKFMHNNLHVSYMREPHEFSVGLNLLGKAVFLYYRYVLDEYEVPAIDDYQNELTLAQRIHILERCVEDQAERATLYREGAEERLWHDEQLRWHRHHLKALQQLQRLQVV